MRTSRFVRDRTPAMEVFSRASISLLLHPRQQIVPYGPTTPTRSTQPSPPAPADLLPDHQKNRAVPDIRCEHWFLHAVRVSPLLRATPLRAKIPLELHILPETAERLSSPAALAARGRGSRRLRYPPSLERFPFFTQSLAGLLLPRRQRSPSFPN